MAPDLDGSNGIDTPQASLEPVMVDQTMKDNPRLIPRPATFDDPLEERDYLKGRLAAAFRIFGKYGFDEGVAGHITVRVALRPLRIQWDWNSLGPFRIL
jgi:hypothetical protein